VRVEFAGPVTAAREVNGQELPEGPATVAGNVLVASFSAYQPRTFALKLGAPGAKVAGVQSTPVALEYDLAAASNDDTKSVGGFDAKGDALPAEMLPGELVFNGVGFKLAPAATGRPNAVVAKGQTINLPAGRFNRLYVVAASADGDQKATFRVGGRAVELTIQNWGGFVGQWDTRVWKARPDKVTVRSKNGAAREVELRHDWAVSANHAAWDLKKSGSQDWAPNYPGDYLGLRPGFVKPADIAWYASHHHTPDGLNEPYQYSYLFAYAIDLPAGARTLTLPANDEIRILAVSVAEESPAVKPAQPLYDTLGRTKPGAMMAAK
jgi:alpha-mannosidase